MTGLLGCVVTLEYASLSRLWLRDETQQQLHPYDRKVPARNVQRHHGSMCRHVNHHERNHRVEYENEKKPQGHDCILNVTKKVKTRC